MRSSYSNLKRCSQQLMTSVLRPSWASAQNDGGGSEVLVLKEEKDGVQMWSA